MRLLDLAVLGAGLCLLLAGVAVAQERFDPRSVPAYGRSHAEVYRYIREHEARHLENLQRWLRQPSISADRAATLRMAHLLREELSALGCQEAELMETPGNPGVWAWCDEGAPTTIVVYLMYDVQPAERSEWQVDPFAAEVVQHADLGRVLMARGATDKKGPQRAFLNAVESVRRTAGRLPVNLMFAAEGEEELGSPHYAQILRKYADRLRTASGVLFPSNAQNVDGSVSMNLGAKGLLYFEMAAQGGARGGPARGDIHSANKAIVDAPTWRLTQALASLTSADGNRVLVPGYYQAIREPSADELRLFDAAQPGWSAREQTFKSSLGVARWSESRDAAKASFEYFFGTTLNIAGISSGYTGEGMKTILPGRAVARLDARLVPDQDPDAQLQLIRRHLDRHGFEDIELRKIAGYPAAQSSLSDPFTRAVIGTLNKYGRPPQVAPRHPGSSPYYVFTKELDLPFVATGLGYGRDAHGANELMVVTPKEHSGLAGLPEMEMFFVDLLFAWGSGRGSPARASEGEE